MKELNTQVYNRFKNQYSDCFEVVHLRQVTSIIKKQRTHQSILYNDYLYYDDEIDFMRRYYRIDESQSRINLIVQRFEHDSMFKNFPYYSDQKMTKFRNKGWKRKNKNKQAILKFENQKHNLSYSSYLKSIRQSQLESFVVPKVQSCQSSVHDIFEKYQDFAYQQEVRVSLPLVINSTVTEHQNEDKIKHLIYDFQETSMKQQQPTKKQYKDIIQESRLRLANQTKITKFFKNKMKHYKQTNINPNAKTKNIFYQRDRKMTTLIQYVPYTDEQQHYDYLQILAKLARNQKHSIKVMDTRSKCYTTLMFDKEVDFEINKNKAQKFRKQRSKPDSLVHLHQIAYSHLRK